MDFFAKSGVELAQVVREEGGGSFSGPVSAEFDVLPKPVLVSRLLDLIILALVFIIPLGFLPLTAEYYETTKQALLALLVPAGLVFLGILVLKRGYLVVTKIDKIVGLLVLVYLSSSYFSLAPYSSLLGHFGRFHGGLLSLFFYLGIFYLIVNTVDSFFQIKRIVAAMSLALIVLAIFGIFQFFEFYLFSFGFTRLRSWTPLGSPSALGYLTAAGLPLTLSLASLFGGLGNLFFLGLLAELLLLGLFGDWFIWLIALFGLAIFLVLTRWDFVSKFGKGRLALFLIFLIFCLSLRVPGVRSRVLPPKFQTAPFEITLPLRLSWPVVKKAVHNRPFIGNGPETFVYVYPKFKPPQVNLTPFWNFRFDRPFNEVFYLVATLGILGTLVYFWLWFRLGKTANLATAEVKTYPLADRLLTNGLIAAFFAFLAQFFFYYSVTASAVFFWVIAAMILVVAGQRQTKMIDSRFFRTRLLGLVSLLIIVGFGTLYFGWYYQAAVFYGSGLRAFASNRARVALVSMTRAARLNPFLDVYETGLATVDLAVAQALRRSDQADPETITILIQEGINTTQKAVNLNPANVQNWEHLAGFYRTLVQSAKGADAWVLMGFINAIQLDPLNPGLRENLGSFYFQMGKYPEAETNYQLAISLKPDLALAHYNLSRTYREEKKYEEAKEELRKVLTLLPAPDPARAGIEAQLADLGKLGSGEGEAVAKQIEPQIPVEKGPFFPEGSFPSGQVLVPIEPLVATSSAGQEISIPTPPSQP